MPPARFNSLEKTVEKQNETIQKLEYLVKFQIKFQSDQAEKQSETMRRLESMIQSKVRLHSEQGQRQREVSRLSRRQSEIRRRRNHSSSRGRSQRWSKILLLDLAC
jgi:predicted RNase H-like nuclease (RuvC/YqgF family)